MTSLVERKSRFTFLLPNGDKRSAAVEALDSGRRRHRRGAPGALPEDARRTVTFDRGTEFAGYAALDRELAVASYFCDPHRPWQKGGVENMNGRARRFLPRSCEPDALGRVRLRRLADRLNDTPRRCLGYTNAARGLRAAPGGPDRAALTLSLYLSHFA